jgi:transposase
MDHEQRIKNKFCFKLQKIAKETHEKLKLIYGDAAVTLKKIYKWFEGFRNGCDSVEDGERSGPPSTTKTRENVERVREMIRSNRRLTIREISEDLNISYGSVQNILTTQFNMMRVSAEFFPRVLTVKQKQ